MWWHVPLIPAIQEAKTGELLEYRWQRLQQAEFTPLHTILDNRAKLHLRNKNKNKKKSKKTARGLHKPRKYQASAWDRAAAQASESPLLCC